MLDLMLARFRKHLHSSAKRYKNGVNTGRFDTSDIVQESLMQIWLEIEKVGSEKFQANRCYLRKVCNGNGGKLFSDHLAKKRSIKKEVGGYDQVQNQPGSVPEPGAIVEQQEAILELIRSISKLNQIRQVIIYRRFFDRLSFVEISRELELPVTTIRRNCAKALTQIRRSL